MCRKITTNCFPHLFSHAIFCLRRCQIKARWQQKSLRSSWVCLCFCLKSGRLAWTQTLVVCQLSHRGNIFLFFFSHLQASAGWEDGPSVSRRLCGGFEVLPKPLLTDLQLLLSKSILMCFQKELNRSHLSQVKDWSHSTFFFFFCYNCVLHTLCCCSINHPSCLLNIGV